MGCRCLHIALRKLVVECICSFQSVAQSVVQMAEGSGRRSTDSTIVDNNNLVPTHVESSDPRGLAPAKREKCPSPVTQQPAPSTSSATSADDLQLIREAMQEQGVQGEAL